MVRAFGAGGPPLDVSPDLVSIEMSAPPRHFLSDAHQLQATYLARLDSEVPSAAQFAIVYAQDRAIRFVDVEPGAHTIDLTATGLTNCGATIPDDRDPAPGESIQLAWVDIGGRVSPRSVSMAVRPR
jgi:hypothetical protein